MERKNKIFLATPISAFGSDEALAEYKLKVKHLVNALEENQYSVFSEVCRISTSVDYDSPEESLRIDMAEIKTADFFVMHYPKPMATSALIEMGMAMGFNKKVVIITPSREILPDDMPKLDEKCGSVKIIESPDLDTFCTEQILGSLQQGIQV